MILCGITCLVLAVVMILTRTRPIFSNIRSPCALLMCFCVLGILAETAGSMDAGGIASGKLKRKAPGRRGRLVQGKLLCPRSIIHLFHTDLFGSGVNSHPKAAAGFDIVIQTQPLAFG